MLTLTPQLTRQTRADIIYEQNTSTNASSTYGRRASAIVLLPLPYPQRVVGSPVGHEERRRGDEVHSRRKRGDAALLGDEVGREAAGAHESHHAITHPKPAAPHEMQRVDAHPRRVRKARGRSDIYRGKALRKASNQGTAVGRNCARKIRYGWSPNSSRARLSVKTQPYPTAPQNIYP